MVQQLEQLWEQRLQRLNTVVASSKHNYCDGKGVQILLELDVSICGEEHVKLCCSEGEELPVLYAGPARSRDGDSIMASYQKRKASRK